MNCEICFVPFDHSIRKPYHLVCAYTYCLSCIIKLTNNKYPTCNKRLIEKNPNIALLKVIKQTKCLIS